MTFTATVSPAAGNRDPTGTVTFTADGVATAGRSTRPAWRPSRPAALPAGTHTVTADYGGDAAFLPARGSVDQTVNKTATTTVVVSELNPSIVGDT